jgi:hypothetical protein
MALLLLLLLLLPLQKVLAARQDVCHAAPLHQPS